MVESKKRWYNQQGEKALAPAPRIDNGVFRFRAGGRAEDTWSGAAIENGRENQEEGCATWACAVANTVGGFVVPG